MSTITYTTEVHSNAIFDSSLVDEVYYNENTNDLYVDLNSSVYKYSDVPKSVVDEFQNADSAGTFYNTRIKGKFPSVDLGNWTEAVYDNVTVLEKSVSQPVTVNVAYTGGAVGTFSLKPFTDDVKVEGTEREYAVTFEVDGLDGRKTHTLKSTSVDEAVTAVLDLGKMLDLTFVVREVTIRFE